MLKSFSLISLFFLLGCGVAATRPKIEMAYAQSAFLAAKAAGAQVSSAAQYRKAEYYYLKAKSAYKRKYFNKAKQYAILSKKFSEEAEYTAVRKKALENLE